MTKEDAINLIIKDKEVDTNKISDGYHTFGQLYEHRIVLFIGLCVYLYRDHPVWRSKAHSDGSVWDGWFIMGINTEPGEQITYHLPMSHWPNTAFCKTLEKAPEWDGHTSDDVLERLKGLK
jgi:hypothetical protein